ncbi:MAG: hydroxymethylbilane synthase [Chloroflexi bacterium]|nr:hydroxymethylbilane synthase [Chloroflexota bacterium]
MTTGCHPSRTFVLGTRGSALAVRQANLVRDAILRIKPEAEIQLSVIRAHGDEPTRDERDHASFTAESTVLPSGEGIFVRSIETALIERRIDLAVHSFKDMPSVGPSELSVGAFPVREDPRDVLVAKHGHTLSSLPTGAVIGTGSPRRRALLLTARPDLRVEPVRGNVDTRLRSIQGHDLAGIVLAAAGLKRLGRQSEITEWLDPATFVPAIGQGTLAVQVRTEDEATLELVRCIDDPDSRACALAERAVAIRVNAGCTLPVAAHARRDGSQIAIHAFILAQDGRSLVRAELRGPSDRAEEIGSTVGDLLLEGQRTSP